MNVEFAVALFFRRKQEKMDAICALTTAPEGIQGIHSKFRINRTFGSKMCECRIRRTFRGAKSVNMAIFSKPGSKKCECQNRRTFFFCRKQEEMHAICAFTAAPEGIQEMHSKYRIYRTFGRKMCECQIRRTFSVAKSVNMANFPKPGSKK